MQIVFQLEIKRTVSFGAAMQDHWSQVGMCSSSSGAWVLVEVRGLYYVYMALLTIFCTNAINIYAGARASLKTREAAQQQHV